MRFAVRIGAGTGCALAISRTVRVRTALWLACAGQSVGEQLWLPPEGGQQGICTCRWHSGAALAQNSATSGVAAHIAHSASISTRRARR